MTTIYTTKDGWVGITPTIDELRSDLVRELGRY